MWISNSHKYVEMFINTTLINLYPISKDKNSTAMRASQSVRIIQMSQQVNPTCKVWLKLEEWLDDNLPMPQFEGS